MPAPSQHAFAEKVALVTDGSNPVGRAIAMQLALCGCYVIVGNSASSEEEKRLLAELKSLGTLAHYVDADLSTVAGSGKIVKEVEKIYGRLDLLINCQRSEGVSSFENTTEEMFAKMIDANLKGTYFVTKEALRLMKPRPRPKIVTILSACDSAGTKNNPAFVAVNGALAALTKNLAENLPANFRINAVSVSEKQKTPAHFEKFDQFDTDLFREKKGVGSDDIARTVLYLLSAEAIGINGQVLKIE